MLLEKLMTLLFGTGVGSRRRLGSLQQSLDIASVARTEVAIEDIVVEAKRIGQADQVAEIGDGSLADGLAQCLDRRADAGGLRDERKLEQIWQSVLEQMKKVLRV